MKTQVIVSSKAFKKWLIDVWSSEGDEDIVFEVAFDKIFAGDSAYIVDNQAGFGQYHIGADSVKRLIKTLKIIPLQPVKIIFEGSRVGIECQV